MCLYALPQRHTRRPSNKVVYLYTCSIVNMFTFYCMYVSDFSELLFVWACITTCSKATTARPTLCDGLRASVYLLALPFDVRAQVCLVFVACIALLCIFMICIRNMAPRWWISK